MKKKTRDSRAFRWRVAAAVSLAILGLITVVVPAEAHALMSAAAMPVTTAGWGLSDIGIGLVVVGGVSAFAIFRPRRAQTEDRGRIHSRR